MIKILITDDDIEVAQALKRNIDGTNGIQVVGIANQGAEAIRFCNKDAVDVVLMDFKMPHMDGIETSKRIKACHPNIKIIILTSFSLEETILNAIKYSCSGYILKGYRAERIVGIIQNVCDGFTVFDPEAQIVIENQLTKHTVDKSELEILSPQEIKMVSLVTAGKTDAEIADSLHLDHGHVRNKLAQIREKLGLRNSKELAVWGARMGLWHYQSP